MNTLITWVIRYLGGITSAQWKTVLEYVRIAADKIAEGADKRTWVLDKMRNIGITGSVANFLVEAAVTYVKRLNLIQA